jgi:hypothetical protein
MSVDVREAVDAWVDCGYSVIPIREDGAKRPAVPWKHYQSEAANADQVNHWFYNGQDRAGLGVVTGFNDLEMFEFETAPAYVAFKAAADATGLRDLVERIDKSYLEETPGGGYHWFWRCDAVEGSTVLAKRTSGQPLIETRGVGGFAVVAPSHLSGKSYRLREGSPYSIPEVTPEEREALFRLASTFDELPQVERAVPARATTKAEDQRPGDDYNAKAEWPELLRGAGWTDVYEQDGRTYWRRPGKDSGISATTNYAGSDLLWMFSTSTTFEPNRSYDKFGAYAVLHHDGDLGAAAKDLASKGYGQQARQRAAFTRVTARELAADPAPLKWLVKGLLPEATYGPVAGERKSLKSWTSLGIAVAVAAGVPVLGRFEVPHARPVVYYCGEGGERMFRRRLRRVAEAYGVAVETLPLVAYFDVAPLDSDAFQASLSADLAELSPGLVIVDPLYAFHGTETRSSDLYQRGSLLSAASAPVVAAGATLLINDHFNKTGSGGDLGRIAQAGMGEWADTWLLLSHRVDPDVAGGDFRLRLDVGSRQWGGRTFDLDLSIGEFDEETGEHVGDLSYMVVPSDPDAGKRAKEASAHGRAERELLDVLRDEPFEHTKTSAIKEVGGRAELTRAAWDSLVGQRLIVSRKDTARNAADRRTTREVWAVAEGSETRVRMGGKGGDGETERPEVGTAGPASSTARPDLGTAGDGA